MATAAPHLSQQQSSQTLPQKFKQTTYANLHTSAMLQPYRADDTRAPTRADDENGDDKQYCQHAAIHERATGRALQQSVPACLN